MLPKTLVTAAPDGAQDAGINAAKVGRRLARSRPPPSLSALVSQREQSQSIAVQTLPLSSSIDKGDASFLAML